MNITPQTEHLLQFFILTAGVLLIPVLVGIMVVLFKLGFLIHSASEFLQFATGEILPMLKEARLLVSNMGDISQRASDGVVDLTAGFHQALPSLKKGLYKLTKGSSNLVAGLGRSVRRMRNKV